MICLLTATGLSSGGNSAVHIYTKTIRTTTQNKQYIEQHKNVGSMQVVPHLGELYSRLTTEEKARKNLEIRKNLRLNHTIKLCNTYGLSTQIFCTHAPKWYVICTLNKLPLVRVRGRLRYKMFGTEFCHTFTACNLL